MKVIQICGAQHAGGAEAHFLRFCVELNRYEGIEVIAIVRKGSWLEQQLLKENIRIFALGFRSSFDFFTAHQIKKISHHEKTDIIQCWMNRAASLTPKSSHGFKIGRLGGYYALKNYKTMDWLVGATEDICHHIKEKGWSGDRLSCIPNFVNIPKPKQPEESLALKKEMGLTEKTVLFTPARLHSVKGLDTAIEALKRLPENFVYLIVGNGPEEENLRSLAKKLNIEDRVIFAGWQNNITPYCYISDIFIVPSRHEPFGSVLLEAWSHQLPLITSDSQGARAITRHQETCFIFRKNNVQELTTAILAVESNVELKEMLIKQGYDELIKKYTAKPVLDCYIATYTKAN